MNKNKIKLLCLSGVFAALIYFFTAYVRIPSHTGYTHIGDGIIYLSACLLPLPYALFSACFGAAFADLLSGYAIWAPATILIKGVTVLYFERKKEKIITKRNILALVFSALTCMSGYYIYDVIVTGNFISPLAGIPGYITQSVLSSILFVFCGVSFDKLKIKNKLLK